MKKISHLYMSRKKNSISTDLGKKILTQTKKPILPPLQKSNGYALKRK